MNRISLAIVVVLFGSFSFDSFATSGQEDDALERLEKAKKKYEEVRLKALEIWEKQIDKMVKAPKHNMSANQAIQLNNQLLAMKTLGSRYDDVPENDLVLGLAAEYYSRIAKARWTLYLAYEAMNRQLQHGKFEEVDHNKLQEETQDFMRDTERQDKIKPGHDFHGSRHDPALNIHVPIHFKVTERNGHNFTGRIDFNNGQAIFKVFGTIKGLEIEMQKVGVMVKGKERYFEYHGYIVGNRLLLDHQGFTTEKKRTAGWSWMRKK